MENETQEQLTPEQEIVQLKARQAELASKLEEARAATAQKKLQAIAEAAAARKKVEEEEKAVIQEIARRRKQREEDERASQERVETEQRAAREAAELRAQTEKAARNKYEAEQEALRFETEKAYNLEKALLAEVALQQQGFTVNHEEKPKTLADSVLGRILAGTDPSVQIDQSLSSEENARLQTKLDAAVPVPVKKNPRYPDTNISGELEGLLRRELKINPTISQCDRLAATYNEVPLMKAARDVANVAKAKSMSMDSVFYLIELTLETEASNESPS